ncbi:hypothetical protein MJH12_01925 [bacterium]|nr:hypothetical protein [bacterium]
MSALKDHNKKPATYTLEEASKITKIGSFTLNMYLKSFPSHIDVLKNSKDSQILNTSIPVLHQIRDLYRSGKSTEEIRSNLTALIVNNATKDQNIQGKRTHIIQTLIAQKNEISEIRRNQKKFQELAQENSENKSDYFQIKLQEVDKKSQASYENCLKQLQSLQLSVDNNDYFQTQIEQFEKKLEQSFLETNQENLDEIHQDVLAKIKVAWIKQQENNEYKLNKLGGKLERWETLFRSIIDQQVLLKKEISVLKKKLAKHQHPGFFTQLINFFN